RPVDRRRACDDAVEAMQAQRLPVQVRPHLIGLDAMPAADLAGREEEMNDRQGRARARAAHDRRRRLVDLPIETALGMRHEPERMPCTRCEPKKPSSYFEKRSRRCPLS